MPTDDTLKDVSVMVTRPVEQAENLCRLIEKAGGEAVRFPVMEIRFAEGSSEASNQVRELDQYHMAIFVSANAVRGADRIVRHKMPEHLLLAAVGKSTAEAVSKCWQREVITPTKHFNSEGLLALPELQGVEGQKIIIFRGQGGRELLADELTKRGAEITYAEVYHRVVPQKTMGSLRGHSIDVITVTSNEGLQNLYHIAGTQDRAWLLDKHLVVISQRTADLAGKLGFQHPPIIAPSANDEGLLAAILAWKANKPR